MAIQLLAFDLDGTTLVNHWELPEENRRALLAAAEQGVILVPATGRMLSFLPEAIRALPVRYAITSNGGAVYDWTTGTPVVENPIPNQKAQAIQDILDEYDIYIEYYTQGRAITRRDLRDRALAGMVPERKHWLIREKDYLFTEDFGIMLQETGLCPEKINLPYMEPAQRQEIWRRLEDLGGLRPTSSIPDNLEINSWQAHKGQALLDLAERLGIPPGDLMALGDNGNDVTMLQAAGCSVAVADGSPEALAAAKHTTAAHDQNGLALAVRRFIL